jgi:hypothetical protein
MTQDDLRGDANTEIAIGDENGKVVLTFSKPVRWLELDAEAARRIGEQLARSAYTVTYGAPPANRGSVLKAHVRNTLINRFVIVDRSMREQGKNPAYIATTLVDLFLSEVS